VFTALTTGVVAIDDDAVWRAGVSVQESPNHRVSSYNQARISLLHLTISLLSQPLFHTPDEYLVILNPFATYLTSRRCKNVKNLFISLINVVISYDASGYVSFLYLTVYLLFDDRASLT
jgi:hypothetical protein